MFLLSSNRSRRKRSGKSEAAILLVLIAVAAVALGALLWTRSSEPEESSADSIATTTSTDDAAPEILPKTADELLGRVKELRSAKKDDAAGDLLLRGLEKFSRDGRVVGELAMIRLGQRRYEDAAGYLSFAVQLRPDWHTGLDAAALLHAADADETLRDGTKAVQQSMAACVLTQFRYPDYLATLAAAFAEFGWFEEAVLAAGRAEAGAKNLSPEVQQAIREQGAKYKAREPYRLPAGASQPTDVEALMYLAQSMESEGRIRAALSLYNRVLAADSTQARVAGRIAWYLATLKDPELQDPERALELAGLACDATQNSDPAMLDALAASLAAVNRFEDAASIGRKAITKLLERREPSGIVIAGYREREQLYRSDKKFETTRGQLLRRRRLTEWDVMLPATTGRLLALAKAARIMATHDDPRIRDPALAVTLAEMAKADTAGKNAVVSDTLAVAYASADRFEDAMYVVRQYTGGGQADDGTQDLWDRRLTAFRNGTPVREPLVQAFDEKEPEEGVAYDPALAFTLSAVASELLSAGWQDEAIQTWMAAVRSDPRYALAEIQLGKVLAAKGQFALAAGYLVQAIAAKPENAEPVEILAFVCGKAGAGPIAAAIASRAAKMKE